MALDDGDVMSCFGKKIGGADADDASADNYDLLCHLFNLSLGVWTGVLRAALYLTMQKAAQKGSETRLHEQTGLLRHCSTKCVER